MCRLTLTNGRQLASRASQITLFGAMQLISIENTDRGQLQGSGAGFDVDSSMVLDRFIFDLEEVFPSNKPRLARGIGVPALPACRVFLREFDLAGRSFDEASVDPQILA